MRNVTGLFGLVSGLTVLPPDFFGIKPQSDGGQGSGGKHNEKRRQGLQRRGIGGAWVFLRLWVKVGDGVKTGRRLLGLLAESDA